MIQFKSLRQIVLVGLVLAAVPLQAQKAFPTAEGFGKKATGGRGGEVVEVTNLQDDAAGSIEGSFRWALRQYTGSPLTVVFRVSGDIKLVAELKCSRTTGLTIAGQTAPGDGISFSHNKMNFGGSANFIIRNIRSRIGVQDASGSSIYSNALGAENCQNFIIDHCSFGWSGEENMNTFDDHFHTVQWCILHESLYNSGHPKGSRGYACQWGGSEATYHHNLLANNYSRSCRFNGARGTSIEQDVVVFIEYINNVNYNWGDDGSIYGGENTGENTKYFGHACNFINNYYKPGPVTSSNGYYFIRPSYARTGATSYAEAHGPSKWYLGGNVMEASGNVSAANAQKVTGNNWEGIEMGDAGSHYTKDQMRVDSIIVPNQVRPTKYQFNYSDYKYSDYETAAEAYQSVVSQAGALPHDVCDTRILSAVKNGTGDAGATLGKGIIDNPADVGGFPTYSTNYTQVVDADHDGIDDAWEVANKLDPTDKTDRNKLTGEGYTALEVYLNSLMGENIEHDFGTGTEQKFLERITLLNNVTSNQLNLASDHSLSGAYVYNTSGLKVLSVRLDLSSTIDVTSLPSGQYILVAYTVNGEPKSFKFIKE